MSSSKVGRLKNGFEIFTTVCPEQALGCIPADPYALPSSKPRMSSPGTTFFGGPSDEEGGGNWYGGGLPSCHRSSMDRVAQLQALPIFKLWMPAQLEKLLPQFRPMVTSEGDLCAVMKGPKKKKMDFVPNGKQKENIE
jgi:hypothetical protein